MDRIGRLKPRTIVGKFSEEYGRANHVSTGGPWDYDLTWKPPAGFQVLAGWLRAVREGQAELARGLQLRCPVFVACSTKSANAAKSPEQVRTADIILNVDHIALRSARLGGCVLLVRIDNGIHDLSLSAEPARTEFFAELMMWQRTYVPERASDPQWPDPCRAASLSICTTGSSVCDRRCTATTQARDECAHPLVKSLFRGL